MDFDEKDDDIILLLLVASGVTNVLSVLAKSRWQLVWVKTLVTTQIQKSVHYNTQHYIGTKTTRPL